MLSPLRLRLRPRRSLTDPLLRQVLQPAAGDAPRPGQLQYSTIHAFKGLDSPAVIVTDLDRRLVPNFESLLYVGLTRATDRLSAVIETADLQHHVREEMHDGR